MKGTSSYQRTSKYYRGLGFVVWKTEYYSRGLRHDLGGYLDAIALAPGQTVGLQACGGGDFAEHYRKITIQCREQAETWLLAGNMIHLIGWRKVGPRGKRKLWEPRIQIITLEDLRP